MRSRHIRKKKIPVLPVDVDELLPDFREALLIVGAVLLFCGEKGFRVFCAGVAILAPQDVADDLRLRHVAAATVAGERLGHQYGTPGMSGHTRFSFA